MERSLQHCTETEEGCTILIINPWDAVITFYFKMAVCLDTSV